MSDSKNRKPLFEEFPPVSKEEWEKVIKQDLNGADYKDKLEWDTGEGVTPLPFYRREDISGLERNNRIPKSFKNHESNAWEIREPIFETDIAKANKAARNALDRGADALQFHLEIRRTEGMLGGDLQGLPILKQNDFSELLDGIAIKDTALNFDSGLASPALIAMLWNEVNSQNINDAEQVTATFMFDPYTYVPLNGQLPKDYDQIENDIIQLSRFAVDQMPGIRPLGIDARTFHNAGATIVQELAFAMSGASEYLAILADTDSNIEKTSRLLHFSFSIGSNYFLEIAKFRAARLFWKNLIEAYGGNPQNSSVYLHGETSQWNKTIYDSYTNMLRTSTEGMSAAIGGCDSITILPFDQHFRQPDDFSQRIARNQQLIFSEEAFLNKVEDPGAGSYYIEQLTEDIARKAWQLFQDIETEGGLLEAAKNGTVQSAIEESQQKRDQAIATRQRTLVGTNKYTNPDDKMTEQIDPDYKTFSLGESEEQEFNINPEQYLEELAGAFADGASIGDLVVPYLFDFGKHYIRTVAPYRGAQAFEELRLATENHESTPRVLNLPLGNKKWRKSRAAFSTNFFGCAGYDIEDPVGFEDLDAAIKAIHEQKPDIAVICSSDEEYQELVPKIGQTISELDQQPILVLAGYPKENIKTYTEAGVDDFIYSDCNALKILKSFQHKLGIINE